jgi:hypothetical protein
MKQSDALARQLAAFLHQWATTATTQRWERFVADAPDGGPWLDTSDFNSFVRYLCDYLLTEPVFNQLSHSLGPIVNLKIKDEAARRHARRKYVRIVVNDFLMNPGGGMAPIPEPDAPEPTAEEAVEAEARFADFGLMATFLRRWSDRLPQALALGAGEHVQIPPGNAELIAVLDPFDK